MKGFIDNPDLLIEEFNLMSSVAQKKAYITIGIELQKDEIQTLIKYRQDLVIFKKEVVHLHLEKLANLIFCIDKSLLAVQYELQMLVNLKEDKMNEAWGNLVNAQIVYGNVLKNYPTEFQSSDGYIERLSNYENLLFPEMHFHSVGGIIKKSHCSICNGDFNKCDHIKGKLYNGEMCCRVITEMDLEEISLVENPANKHCRILTVEQNGKEIDIMTLRMINS